MKQSVILRGSLSFSKRPGFYVQNVIDSIRGWFDGEIIVSTWMDQEAAAKSLVGADKIILNPDPGDGPVQQMQRQLNSYWAGVNACSGDQILVTRTDILHFKNLFNYIGKSKQYTKENLSCFSEKLVIGNIMTISPESTEANRTFRPCDWFQCGTRQDIEKWCSIIPDLSEISRNELNAFWEAGATCTEKLWFSLVFNKYSKHTMDWRNTSTHDHLAWHVLVDNFILLDQISTAGSINLNWAFQPQRLDCYVTEEQFNRKVLELCE